MIINTDKKSHPRSEQIGRDIKEGAGDVNTAAQIAEPSELVFKISHYLLASLLGPLACLLPLPSAPSNQIPLSVEKPHNEALGANKLSGKGLKAAKISLLFFFPFYSLKPLFPHRIMGIGAMKC